ncbi:replicative DNA helicase [bacterium]|nr:replicative DNA helicase [Candidatus Neomarinimicrobiota bacterium]MCK5684461.1 replicative DNA helicase [bacterium]
MDVSTVTRIPPQSLESEIAVLGAMMLEPQGVYEAFEVLSEEDFYTENHKVIFAAMLKIFQENNPVDQLTVTQYLHENKELEKAGGAAYITNLLSKVPTAANLRYYAKIVKDKSTLRSIINVATGLITDAYNENKPAEEILDTTQQKIFSLKEGVSTRTFVSIGDSMSESIDHIQKMAAHKGDIVGVPTGFYQLDSMTTGFQPSDLVILAGRPSMGKTASALSMARTMAIDYHKKVGIFSLEMSVHQLSMRLLSAESKIDHQLLRKGKVPTDLWLNLTQAASNLTDASIYVDETPGISIMEIRSRARRLKMEKGLDIIFVDYLQLAKGAGKIENRTQEISMISMGLKALAKELNIPVVALSQLSRAVEQRGGDHRPQLSDLRESGAIEQDADVVMFVYREFVYSKDPEHENRAELIVSKQRNGPIGEVPLIFNARIARFDNPASGEYDNESGATPF